MSTDIHKLHCCLNYDAIMNINDGSVVVMESKETDKKTDKKEDEKPEKEKKKRKWLDKLKGNEEKKDKTKFEIE